MVDFAVGVVPSVVYRKTEFALADESDTCVHPVKLPPLGEIVGAAACVERVVANVDEAIALLA